MGKPKRKIKEERVTIIYRPVVGDSDPEPLRLKVEINTVERFSHEPLEHKAFEMETPWFSGKANLLTYSPNELMGTKLRALYQRKKARDLFDIARALEQLKSVSVEGMMACFHRYMDFIKHKVSRAEFEKNMMNKKEMTMFREDLPPLLATDAGFDFDKDFDLVMNEIVAKLPGEPWKGEGAA